MAFSEQELNAVIVRSIFDKQTEWGVAEPLLSVEIEQALRRLGGFSREWLTAQNIKLVATDIESPLRIERLATEVVEL